MKNTDFKFILLYSSNGSTPMALEIFKTADDAREAMREDYDEHMFNAKDEHGEDSILGADIKENEASIYVDSRDSEEYHWSIVNVDDINREGRTI